MKPIQRSAYRSLRAGTKSTNVASFFARQRMRFPQEFAICLTNDTESVFHSSDRNVVSFAVGTENGERRTGTADLKVRPTYRAWVATTGPFHSRADLTGRPTYHWWVARTGPFHM